MRIRVIRGLFLSYVIPTIIAMFISGVYQITDGVFVGNYIGDTGLSGVNMGWSIATIYLGYGLAVGIGVGSLFSIAQGENDEKEADKILGQSVFLILVPGILMGILMLLIAEPIVDFLNTDAGTKRYALDFIYVLSMGAPFAIGSIALPFLVRNLGNPNIATLFMAIGALINILSSYVLIVVWEWEVFGAALASISGEALAMILAIIYILSKKRYALKVIIPRWYLIKAIIINGSSGFFTYIYIGFIMLCYQKLLIEYSDSQNTQSLAIYAILGYIITIYYLIAEGIANGAQPIISKLHGSDRSFSLKVIIKMTFFYCLGVGVFMTIILQLFPHFFISFFVNEKDVTLVNDTVFVLRIHLCLLFLEGFFVVAAVFFEALGEGFKALWITIINLFLQVPLLLILPIFMGINGVWITFPLASLILAIPIGIMVIKRYRQIEL